VLLKTFYFLLFLLYFVSEISPRPGMGGSYRSSSSGSSGYRSSSSSSYRSSSSYGSSSNSSYNSNSSYSGPESTSYFQAKDYEISIHFNKDRSAHIKETFTVISKSAEVGILRKKLPIMLDWKVDNLKVSPKDYSHSSFDHQIDISWPKGTNDVDLPLEIEYDIKNGIGLLGEFPIVYWELKKITKNSADGKLEITWDPEIHWNSLVFKQKIYDTNISDYVIQPVKQIIEGNKLTLNFNTLNEKYLSLILSGFPEPLTLNQVEVKENPSQKYYLIKQRTEFLTNTANIHSGQIYLESSALTENMRPNIEFEHRYFLDTEPYSWQSYFQPSYQFTYALSDGLDASFWHLYSIGIEQEPTKEYFNNKEYLKYDIAYSRLGEHKTINDNNTEIIYFAPFKLQYGTTKLKSISNEIIFPIGTDLSKVTVGLYLSECSYCAEISSTLELPASIGKDKNRILLNWEHPIPNDYSPIIKIEMENHSFSRGYFFTYLAALRSLWLSPGSGTNIGYIIKSTILLCIPLFALYFYTRIKLMHLKKKQKFAEFISTLKSSDASFDLEEFLNKTKQIAEKIVSAWCEGNMEPARHFISAGVFQRFQIQLKLLNELDKMKNYMDEFQVLSQEIIHSSTYNGYTTVHLKMRCRAKDISLPIITSKDEIQKAIQQSNAGTYEEVYSFTRKSTTQTKLGVNLFSNLCPSCGGDTKSSHITNKCQYCGTIYNSGEADWVLSEITQIIEWDFDDVNSKKSMEQMIQKSPTPIQIIEDRASALLWKWLFAKFHADPRYLKRESSNTKLLESLKNQENFYIPVIGSAEINDISINPSEAIANVSIRWSAARSLNAIPENRLSNLRLKLNVNRDTKLGFGEVSCKNCGAPFPEIDANQCSYCGEIIPTQVADWLLDNIN